MPEQLTIAELPPTRPVTQKEWDEIDPETKQKIAGSIHREIAFKMEPRIRDQVVFGLREKKNPDGGLIPGMVPNNIVVLIMHRDEPIVPPPVRAAHPNDDWIIMMNNSRETIAEALAAYPSDDSGPKIYATSSKIFRSKIAPDTFTTAVFWGGGHVSVFMTTLEADQIASIRAMGPVVMPQAVTPSDVGV